MNRQLATTVAFIAGFVVALVFYFALIGRAGVQLIQDGRVVSIVLGIAVLILPLIGVWVVYATLRAGLAHQHLSRRIEEEGLVLDVSELPRMPSGRIERGAADELFEQVKGEWEADPDNWRNSYRLARAYDYAGDRGRARETMRRAVHLEKLERQ
ncbi:CvpA family protein [Aldersonia kunmingensis]|uniref:CvpA family protein n=1 Tax=Aldersonia kunmingensis TaxID=408066 RepID=UPI00082D31FA|nr:CvpA family protein [Aldersonia kunmingensis]